MPRLVHTPRFFNARRTELSEPLTRAATAATVRPERRSSHAFSSCSSERLRGRAMGTSCPSATSNSRMVCPWAPNRFASCGTVEPPWCRATTSARWAASNLAMRFTVGVAEAWRGLAGRVETEEARANCARGFDSAPTRCTERTRASAAERGPREDDGEPEQTATKERATTAAPAGGTTPVGSCRGHNARRLLPGAQRPAAPAGAPACRQASPLGAHKGSRESSQAKPTGSLLTFTSTDRSGSVQ
jgi:hypothetical protein